MTISQEAYSALEAAVGKRFVSKDPAIIFGNAWNAGVATNHQYDRLPPSDILPIAVVLPGTVEEVAAVVKVCSLHSLNFKAFSVGWGNFGGMTRPNSVSIDLRRMDHCEIDERNMVATIGPYVTAGQLMAEAMKHGLTCHVVGAGATHSPLASATSGWGIGISGATTGHNARNLLSLEWVTPEGEIVRIGSAGSGAGWAIADNPGPGFRGMIRGFMGTVGGLGVFTRIGYRLHPWHGPRRLELTGQHPQVGMKIGDNFVRFYHGVWSSWEDVRKAAFEFNAAGVTTVQLRMPPENIGWTLTATNNDYLQLINTDSLPGIARQENGCSWSIITTAYSEKHDAYNDRVVRHIIERTQGRVLDVEPEHAEIMARALATSCYIPRVLRPTIYIASTFGVFDSFHNLPRAIQATKDLYAHNEIAMRNFHTVGTEQNWIWPTERRSLWTENILVAGGKQKQAAALYEAVFVQEHLIEKRKLGVSGFALGPLVDMVGPNLGNAHRYMREVKRLFDPKELSDPFMYISKDPLPPMKLWPIVKKFLFRPAFRSVLKKVTLDMVKKKS